MTGTLARAAGLTALYLLVLASVAPGDVLVGGLLGLALALALRPRGRRRARAGTLERVRATAGAFGTTAFEIVRGSWRVARLCLGDPEAPGLVEIPRDGRTRREIALWAVLTSEAPDEIVVDVVPERDVLVVHVVDASDPDAVRARHRRASRRRHSRVVP